MDYSDSFNERGDSSSGNGFPTMRPPKEPLGKSKGLGGTNGFIGGGMPTFGFGGKSGG